MIFYIHKEFMWSYNCHLHLCCLSSAFLFCILMVNTVLGCLFSEFIIFILLRLKLPPIVWQRKQCVFDGSREVQFFKYLQFDVNFQQRNYAFAQTEYVNITLYMYYGDINVSIACRQNVLVSKFISHFKINAFIACSIFFQYLIVSGIFFKKFISIFFLNANMLSCMFN